jgi:hypothetical protein
VFVCLAGAPAVAAGHAALGSRSHPALAELLTPTAPSALPAYAAHLQSAQAAPVTAQNLEFRAVVWCVVCGVAHAWHKLSKGTAEAECLT